MYNYDHEAIKSKSMWHIIKVIYSDQDPIIFELNDKGKLKHKLSRQIPRDISIELQKIQIQKDSGNSQQLNDQKSTDDGQSSLATNSKELISFKHASSKEYEIMLNSAFQFEDNEYIDEFFIYE